MSAQPGLTVGEAAVAAGATNATLRVAVAAEAAFGARTLKVQAKAGERLVAEGNVPVFVRGRAGELDTSFGEEGNAQVPGGTAFGSSLKALPDGKLLAFGVAGQTFALARYGSNGMFDPSFAGGSAATWALEDPFRFSFSGGVHGRVSFAQDEDGYRFECPHRESDANPYLLAVCYTPLSGEPREIRPAQPAPVSVAGNQAIVSGDGLLVGGTGGVVRRLTSSMATDSSFTVIDVIPSQFVNSRRADFMDASPQAVLIKASGTAADSSAWESYVVANRMTGTVIAKSGNTLPRTGRWSRTDFGSAGLSEQGDAAVFQGGFRYLRLGSANPTGAIIQGAAGLNDIDGTENLSFLRASGGAWLRVLFSGGPIRVDVMNESLGSDASIVVGDITQIEGGIFPFDVALTDHRRIVLLLRGDEDNVDPNDPTYPNVFWIVRRYWL